MSDAKKLDQRQLYWNNELASLENANRERIVKAMSKSIGDTLRELRISYAKFQESGGTENRYSIERQAGRYKELVAASEQLFGPNTLAAINKIYERDLGQAYKTGGAGAEDLRSLVEGKRYKISEVTRMPVAAQIAAGQRLEAFWTKERAELRQKVTEATLNALQTGKGWRSAQASIADALRTSGQTILRARDELSVTARGGIVMNLEKRADLIARTELASAYVQGQMRQYRKNGYEHGRWSATGERTCPFCASREGVIYLLDDLETAIPAHPRCRCTIIPVDSDSVRRFERAGGTAEAAAGELDDAGWAAIRQQRFDEYLKFTGKPSLDAAKYLRTPTNSEKFFKGRDAEAIKPLWMPSGSAIPNLAKAAAAAEKAAKAEKEAAEAAKETGKELTPEEEIVQDVMNDPRFKSDAQRTREMRARFGRAGLSKDQDWVKLAASARAKAGAGPSSKDLEKQAEEARKAAEKKAAAEAKAKAEAAAKAAEKQKVISAELKAQIKRAEQRVKDAKGRLDMAKAALPTWKKMKPEAEVDLKAKQAEAAKLAKEYDEASKQYDVLKKEVTKQEAALKQRLSTLQKLNEDLDAANLKLETLKADAAAPGSAKAGLSDIEYSQKVARMAHTPESLARMSQDVLDRAGVKLEDLRSTVKTKAEVDKAIESAEYFGKMARDNIKRTQANIKEQQAKLKEMPDDSKWMVEHSITIAERNIKDATEKAKMWEKDAKDLKAQRSKAPDKNPALEAAQKVIDELKRTSPLSAGDALKRAKEISSESNYRQNISERGAFQAPQNITDMADAAQMYGSFNNLRAYGATEARGYAAEPAYDKLTNRFLETYPRNMAGFINAGLKKSGDKFRATQFHELGHFVEFSNADIYVAAKRFIGDHIQPNRMKPGTLKGYSRNEKFYKPKDGYEPVNPYALKDYTPAVNGVTEMDGIVYNLQKGQIPPRLQRLRDATEITSMGLENLADPKRLADFAAKDLDHLMFSLGTARLAQARAAAGIKHFNYEDFNNTPHVRAQDIPASEKASTKSTAKSSAKEIREVEADIKKLNKERDKFFDLDWDLDPENLLDQANEKLGKFGDLDELRARAGRASVDVETAKSKLEGIVEQVGRRTADIARLEKDLADYESDLAAFERAASR